eukprot:6467623-Amphidinium_carterae.3
MQWVKVLVHVWIASGGYLAPLMPTRMIEGTIVFVLGLKRSLSVAVVFLRQRNVHSQNKKHDKIGVGPRQNRVKEIMNQHDERHDKEHDKMEHDKRQELGAFGNICDPFAESMHEGSVKFLATCGQNLSVLDSNQTKLTIPLYSNWNLKMNCLIIILFCPLTGFFPALDIISNIITNRMLEIPVRCWKRRARQFEVVRCCSHLAFLAGSTQKRLVPTSCERGVMATPASKRNLACFCVAGSLA